jgi:hypothetical protein
VTDTFTRAITHRRADPITLLIVGESRHDVQRVGGLGVAPASGSRPMRPESMDESTTWAAGTVTMGKWANARESGS